MCAALTCVLLCTGVRSGLALGGPNPGLGAHLDRFPRAAQRRGVGQVQVADRIDGHAVEDRGRGDVDALGDLGVLMSEQLQAQQPPGGPVAKRIDIVATAIFHAMTVDAISDLDLSYTPPLGSPWDAVQAGAQAWTRQVRLGASSAGPGDSG